MVMVADEREPDVVSERWIDDFASQVAATARAIALSADERWCSSILLPSGMGICAGFEGGGIVIGTRAVAVPGEIVRVDFHLNDDLPATHRIRDLLIRELEPFIIGIGNVRVIWEETSKRLIVRLREPRDVTIDH
jgi:hypothetical protein